MQSATISLSPSKSLPTAPRDFAPTTTRLHHTTFSTPFRTYTTFDTPTYLGGRPENSKSCGMELSSMLSGGHHQVDGVDDSRRQNHPYATRNGSSMQESQQNARPHASNMQRPPRDNGAATGSVAGSYPRHSPAKKDQKHVLFQLIGHQDPRIQARLPMRVMISPHDNTDSIIASVRNFYGLYDYGVSFETSDGISIIAAWDNFDSDMTVFVRTVPLPPPSEHARDSVSPKKASLGTPFEMRPPVHSPSRSAVRSATLRSVSPQSDTGRRSASAAPGHRSRSQKIKSKDNSVMGDHEGYSSDNNDNGSVASSRRSKAEEIKAEITVDNIVEGGRRKRAFESSELPLFVPPQVPMNASTSSISPQRRAGPPNASPYANANQHTFSYNQAMPSPQSYNNGFGYALPPFPGNPYQSGFPPQSRQLRGGRPSGGSYASNRNSTGGILPTPDPTIGSVISDEDVALQLMRLGDPLAFSHGRTSTSTLDDALSGKAEAASSDEEDDEEDVENSGIPAVPAFEDVGPQRKKQRTGMELPSDGTSGEEYEDHRDGTFRGESDGLQGDDGHRKTSKPKHRARNGSVAMGKPGKPRALSMSKTKKPSMGNANFHSHQTVPMSPASLPSQSRKASISSTIAFQHHLGADEEDLSSKPRCQRCRKSKKGCDRQRPCGRCRDAGIGADGCVSEDEGNGRKGRYGRHMGVTIKKADGSIGDEDETPPPQQIQPQPGMIAPANGFYLAPAGLAKDKKRKR